jgi:hypothetical protein
MDLTPVERDRLDDYRRMMGPEAGNLAFALDTLTDVLALVGQHTVYCRIEKGPRAGDPLPDLADAVALVAKVKALVQATLQTLRTA